MSYAPNSDFLLEITRGNVPGMKIMRSLGEREGMGTTATGEDVWRGNDLSSTPSAPASDTSIPIPDSAGEQMTVVSENNADNGATATGALTVTLVYLDAAGAEQSEVITMNGTTEVDTVATDIRFVQELHVTTVGSNGVAEGNIRIFKISDDTLVYSMIAQGGNMSMVSAKMIPAGKTLHLREWSAGEATANGRLTVRLRADCDHSVPPVRQAGVFLFKSVMYLNRTTLQMPLAYTIPALSIVKASAWAAAINSELSVHWWGILVDD